MQLICLLGIACRVDAAPPIIDAQAYTLPSELQPTLTKSVQRFNNTLENLLKNMDGLGIAMTVVMPNAQPANETNPHDAETLAYEYSGVVARVAFLGGGGSLNRIIQRAVAEGGFDDEDKRFFLRRAKELLDAGARGFGEIALEKYAVGVDGTQYQHAPADHPLMLLLADIAAERSVPIVVHLEARAKELPRPEKFAEGLYPDILPPNIEAFHRLLEHNRQANIVWAHLGADVARQRPVKLVSGLLRQHPNLYLALSPAQSRLGKPEALLDANGKIAPEWLALMQAYPERFLFGSGQFYLPEASPIHVDYKRKLAEPMARAGVDLLGQLPPELARQIGYENAARLFKLGAAPLKEKP
jgi:predicted TIM-barrel fold metal-dependent hydrolase